jgi:hypothetical protein
MAFLASAGAYAAPYMAAAGSYLAATTATTATTIAANVVPIVTTAATKATQVAAVYLASAPLRWMCTDTMLFNAEHCASAFNSSGCFFMKATEWTSCGGTWIASGQMVYDIAELAMAIKK